jgi:hypothetical protein
MQLTVGSDRINYPGKVATPTTEKLVAKMLFNSVISTKGAGFIIWIKLSDIPDEVINEYKLRDKATKNNSIYIRAKGGMHGLPQAGLLANKLLKNCLNKHGYQQSKLVPGLLKNTRPMQFTLVVDDFGMKYVGKECAQHLKNALEDHYKFTCDWTG